MCRGVWTRKLPIAEIRIQVASPILLGTVADTHMSRGRPAGFLEPVVDFFRRMDVGLILHAGDAGQASILQSLEQVEPVVAVRGNADALDPGCTDTTARQH